MHADDRGHFGPATGPAYAEDVSLPVAFLLAAAAGEGFLDDREEVEAPLIEESSALSDDGTFTVDAAPDAALLTKAAELRTDVFSPHLTTVGSRYLQTRRYEDELREAARGRSVSGGEVVGVRIGGRGAGRFLLCFRRRDGPRWRRRGVARRPCSTRSTPRAATTPRCSTSPRRTPPRARFPRNRL